MSGISASGVRHGALLMVKLAIVLNLRHGIDVHAEGYSHNIGGYRPLAFLIAVAMGGAVGSLLRFILSKFIQTKAGVDFPVGTLLVNLSSAFLIGFSFALLVEKLEVSPELRALFVTGFLGGYSTYSTLFYEAYYMLLNGEWFKLSLYLFLSNLLGLLFVALGYGFGRLL